MSEDIDEDIEEINNQLREYEQQKSYPRTIHRTNQTAP
jgi:hypothetical protein